MFLKCDHLKKLEINRWRNFGLLLAFKIMIIIIINAVRAAQVEQWLAILPHNKNVLSSILPSSQGFLCGVCTTNFLCLFSAPEELHSIIQEVKYRTGLQSAKLIRQLKRRDRLCHKLQKNYDIITAFLQAVSQKRRKTIHSLFLCNSKLGRVTQEV